MNGNHYVVFNDGLIVGIYDACADALIQAQKTSEQEEETYTSVVRFYNGTERVIIFEIKEDGTKITHFENIET